MTYRIEWVLTNLSKITRSCSAISTPGVFWGTPPNEDYASDSHMEHKTHHRLLSNHSTMIHNNSMIKAHMFFPFQDYLNTILVARKIKLMNQIIPVLNHWKDYYQKMKIVLVRRTWFHSIVSNLSLFDRCREILPISTQWSLFARIP